MTDVIPCWSKVKGQKAFLPEHNEFSVFDWHFGWGCGDVFLVGGEHGCSVCGGGGFCPLPMQTQHNHTHSALSSVSSSAPSSSSSSLQLHESKREREQSITKTLQSTVIHYVCVSAVIFLCLTFSHFEDNQNSPKYKIIIMNAIKAHMLNKIHRVWSANS